MTKLIFHISCYLSSPVGGLWRGRGSPESRSDSDSRAYNGPLCPPPAPMFPSSSITPSTRHPVYLPPGPGSISGATPTKPTHRHCQTLCLRLGSRAAPPWGLPPAFVLPHSLPPQHDTSSWLIVRYLAHSRLSRNGS